jgi:hypothetical protein
MTVPPDEAFVFNIVWTGSVFPYLRYFVASQIAHSAARFRFVVNGCPADQVRLMERFAERSRGRVVEVLVTSPTMVNHGAALDTVRGCRDDGDFFCFIDPDILARGPFVSAFADALGASCTGVTSGRGVWVDDTRVPPGHPGVAGEHFYSQDGYLFGSPHLAMYRSGPLAETVERWDVGFVSAGGDLSERARAALRAAGHDYFIYDTAKIVNILFQEDGNELCHFEHPELMHIGGVTHFLVLPGMMEQLAEDAPPGSKGAASRLEVARFTSATLQALAEGRPAPPMPDGLDPVMRERLLPVRDALIELVTRYRDEIDSA